MSAWSGRALALARHGGPLVNGQLRRAATGVSNETRSVDQSNQSVQPGQPEHPGQPGQPVQPGQPEQPVGRVTSAEPAAVAAGRGDPAASAVDLPDAPNPDLCCMSGCDNCVWVQYAVQLDAYCQGRGEQGLRELDARVSDPAVRAYIRLQIRQQLDAPAPKK